MVIEGEGEVVPGKELRAAGCSAKGAGVFLMLNSLVLAS